MRGVNRFSPSVGPCGTAVPAAFEHVVKKASAVPHGCHIRFVIDVVVFRGIQDYETVLIFLPALPVYIAAGVVYGPLEGTLICYLTNIVVNLAMFKSLDFLKDKTDDLFGSRKNKRLEAWLKSQPHPLRAIFLLCLLPVAPAGMVTILAHKTGLSQKQYFKALALGCLPGIAISVLFGNFLMNYVLNVLRSRLHIPQGF